MWSANFEGFWLLLHRAKRIRTPTLTSRDVRSAIDHLSPHLLRDVGLHECSAPDMERDHG